jgi:ribosomal protein S18 acetylase RimI-like enzyme
MIHIRAAQPQDASAIAELMLYAMQDIVYYFIGEENAQKATTFLQTLISQTGNQYSLENTIVAEVDGVVLGQLCCYPGEDIISLRAPVLAELAENYARSIDPEIETQAGEMYIDSLAVSPLARGRGIGKMLLLYAIDLYCTCQHKTLGLLVDRDNPQAKKLYLQLGFREVGHKSVFGKEMFHLQFSP